MPRAKASPPLKRLDEWRVVERRPVGYYDGKILVWVLLVEDDGSTAWHSYYLTEDGHIIEEPVFVPLPGSQVVFLSSPIFETLYTGNRGGGKSDSLLLSYAAGVDKGYGKAWRGILFRREFGDLDDMVRKVETIFPKIYGDRFHFLRSKSEYVAQWDTGEALLLRNLPNVDAYEEYHGHCVDEGEVLTPNGWRDIRTVKVGDLVYTFDADGEMMETVVEQTHVYDYDGDIVRRKSANLYMSFTPKHGLPVVQPDGSNSVRPFDEAGGQFDVPRSITRWAGKDTGEALKALAKSVRLGADIYVQLLAWWLSAGRIVNNYRVISSPSLIVRAKLHQFFDENSIPYLPRRDGLSIGKLTGAHLEKIKELPRAVLDASPDVLRPVLDCLMAASGLWHKPSIDGVFRSRHRAVANNVAEIGVKLGFNVTVKTARLGAAGRSEMHSVVLKPAKPVRLKTGGAEVNVKHFTYKGKVYCIGVPFTHTFVIRQRGCVWLSGNSYAWIGFEELTQWFDDKAYRKMFSCARSPAPGVPVIGIRGTTNPYGPGHTWVKRRFRLPASFGKVIRRPGEVPRVAIQSDLRENFVLLHSNPNYPDIIRQAATSDAEARAWTLGDWDVTSGGMFDDLWSSSLHVVLNILPRAIPHGWKINRSYDHGQAKPFCVLWWAESNGEPIQLPDGRIVGQVPGDIILFAEWYGTKGEPDVGVRMSARQIGIGIRERQKDWGIDHRVAPGPADNEIYTKDQRGTNRSPSDDMEDVGVLWYPADKSGGSRKRGYTMIRGRLSAAIPNRDGSREFPGMWVCQRCVHWLDLVPSAPRDADDQDEVPKKYEDHPIDATRYRLSSNDERPWQRGF